MFVFIFSFYWCFVLCLHVLFCYSLSILHILCFLSGQKLLRLFSSKVYCLCLTACVCCILAPWAPSTSLLLCLLYGRYASLSLCPLFIYLHSCSPPQLLNRHRRVRVKQGALCSAQCGGSQPDVPTVLYGVFKIQISIPHIPCVQRNAIVQVQCGLILAPSVLFHSLLLLSSMSWCSHSKPAAAATASSSFPLLPVNLYLCVRWASQPDTPYRVSRALTDWKRQPCTVLRVIRVGGPLRRLGR